MATKMTCDLQPGDRILGSGQRTLVVLAVSQSSSGEGSDWSIETTGSTVEAPFDHVWDLDQ